MGTLNIVIRMDSAAFDGDAKYVELPRILEDIAQTIEDGSLLGTRNLWDINGNAVGYCKYIEQS